MVARSSGFPQAELEHEDNQQPSAHVAVHMRHRRHMTCSAASASAVVHVEKDIDESVCQSHCSGPRARSLNGFWQTPQIGARRSRSLSERRSHSSRQSRWQYLMEPAQPHGVMSGRVGDSMSRQMLRAESAGIVTLKVHADAISPEREREREAAAAASKQQRGLPDV